MALFSFWGGTTPTGVTTATVSPTLTRGMAFISTTAGTITTISFWKDVGDTGTHVGYLWDELTGVQLGSVTFSGETASGWQTATFTTPIPIASGRRYRAVVSHTALYSQQAAFAGMTAFPLTMDAGGYTGSGTAYPSTAAAAGYLVDVVANITVGTTEGRSTQNLAEAWVGAPSVVRASQTVAETWIRQIPVTAAVASQGAAEVWTAQSPAVVVSQALAEVWIRRGGGYVLRGTSAQAP